MLAVGNILNEGTQRGGACGFTLDSLMKMVNTKGADRKTSLLDYVVKSLYDRGEEGVLCVLQDLTLVEGGSKISGTDVLKEFGNVSKSLEGLEAAYNENTQAQSENTLTSPTAKQMMSTFSNRLSVHLVAFRELTAQCGTSGLILRRKVDDIVRYFGETDAQSGELSCLLPPRFSFSRSQC
jgi:hypothetical protein